MRLAIIGLDSSHCAHFVRFITGMSESQARPLTLSALVSLSPEPPDSQSPPPWDHLLPLIPYPVLTLTGSPQLVAHQLAPHCDAAIIASRDSSTHYAYAHALLSAGIATFVDKPFTRTSVQAQALVELANATGTGLTSFSALRWHSLVTAAASGRPTSPGPQPTYTVYGSAPVSQYGPDFMAVHPVDTARALSPGTLVASQAHRSGNLITLDMLSRHRGQNFDTQAVIDVDSTNTTGFGIQRGSQPIVPITLGQDYLLPGFSAWLQGLQAGSPPVPLSHLVQTVALTERVTALM